MAVTADAPTSTPTRRSISILVLTVFSFVLAIITGIPQLYYVLFSLHLVPIGPNINPLTNPLGWVWYTYILHGEAGYDKIDPGLLSGAVLDVFLLSPMYFATGIGLARRHAWVVPVGLITGGLILYGIVYFFLSDIFSGLGSVTDSLVYWSTSLPYLIYPIWLVVTLLRQRNQFKGRQVI